jgi:hypothetical protein
MTGPHQRAESPHSWEVWVRTPGCRAPAALVADDLGREAALALARRLVEVERRAGAYVYRCTPGPRGPFRRAPPVRRLIFAPGDTAYRIHP